MSHKALTRKILSHTKLFSENTPNDSIRGYFRRKQDQLKQSTSQNFCDVPLPMCAHFLISKKTSVPTATRLCLYYTCTMGPQKDPPKWIKSAAKAYLLELVRNEEIPARMKAKAVHEQFCKHRSEFVQFGDKHFASRLKAVRKKVSDRNDRAARDASALARDRVIYPRPSQDGFGLPFWPDSEAKEQLENDIDKGKHLSMSREALWYSTPVYYESLPFEVFVKHIHQEVKTRKFHTCVEDKRQEKLSKDALKHMPFAK